MASTIREDRALEPLKALDQLRQRLSQFSTALQGLRAELEHSHPLPPWSSIVGAAQILAYNLEQVTSGFVANRQFLHEAHAYPLTNYPGHTHAHVLEQLLRKKLEPRAEEWIDGYTTDDKTLGAGASRRDNVGITDEQFRQLWNWAGPTESAVILEMSRAGHFRSDYTIAEKERGVESVVSGLRRELEIGLPEEEDADEDDGASDTDKIMDGREFTGPPETSQGAASNIALPALSLENTLRFMSTGDINSHLTASN